jgi:hypothetical protein
MGIEMMLITLNITLQLQLWNPPENEISTQANYSVSSVVRFSFIISSLCYQWLLYKYGG